MYGNSFVTLFNLTLKIDKPQHIMYGNFASLQDPEGGQIMINLNI